MNACMNWCRSVTKLGEISPSYLRNILKALGKHLRVYFVLGKFFYLTLAIGQMKIAFEIEHQLTRRDILISLEWARPELKGPGLYFSPQYISLGLNPLLHKWATRASPK